MALNRVGLSVGDGEFVGVVGPNGSGKTTLLRAISGILMEVEPGKRDKPSLSGTISFDGKRIDNLDAWQIVKMGIVHCPERRRPFSEMTTLENLEMGAYLRKDKDGIRKDLDRVYELFPILKDRANQMSQTLSGGEQQMLAIGRGLMAKPKLLCMDEPSLGLAPILVEQMGKTIKDINKRGTSVLLVEQNVHLALEVASRGYALHVGRVVLEGDIEEMKSSDIVKRAYLGG